MARRFGSIPATIGLALMIIGFGIMLTAGALYAYGQYERLLVEREFAGELTNEPVRNNVGPTDATQISPDTTSPNSENSKTEDQSNVSNPYLDIPPIEERTEAPQEKAKPAAPASRIVIASIDVDSPVTEAKIENNEWQVPKFVAGHLEGTANPGEQGNIVLAGHIESISSGNVFARLGELRPGDAVTIFAGDEEFQYQITHIKIVPNDDVSVVLPTAEPTLTLITCAGTFNVLTRDYSHRLIVIAKPHEPAR